MSQSRYFPCPRCTNHLKNPSDPHVCSPLLEVSDLRPDLVEFILDYHSRSATASSSFSPAMSVNSLPGKFQLSVMHDLMPVASKKTIKRRNQRRTRKDNDALVSFLEAMNLYEKDPADGLKSGSETFSNASLRSVKNSKFSKKKREALKRLSSNSTRADVVALSLDSVPAANDAVPVARDAVPPARDESPARDGDAVLLGHCVTSDSNCSVPVVLNNFVAQSNSQKRNWLKRASRQKRASGEKRASGDVVLSRRDIDIDIAAAFGFKIIETPADGNCMFTSIYIADLPDLAVSEPCTLRIFGKELRHNVVDFYHTNRHDERWSNFELSDQYILGMMSVHTWGSEQELEVCAELLNRPIYVYRIMSGALVRIKIGGERFAGEIPVNILYDFAGRHYNALLPL